MFKITHSGFRPKVELRHVSQDALDGVLAIRQFMAHGEGGSAPHGAVWDVVIQGDPHAFFFCGLGFGFTADMWEVVSPVLGRFLETWNVRLEDGDRSIEGVATRARMILEDALDETASDVRYLDVGVGTPLCTGAYNGLVFRPNALDEAKVFQIRQATSSLLATEDVVLELKAKLKEHGLQKTLQFEDTSERAPMGSWS